MGHLAAGFLACPISAPNCNDVSNMLQPLFVLVSAIAVFLALPLARFVSLRRRTGAALFMIGVLAYLYFSPSGAIQAVLAFIVEVLGEVPCGL
jgi:hypothetical protein